MPAIGYKIHTENMNNPAVKINLKGLAIGDGWCDPENVSSVDTVFSHNYCLSITVPEPIIFIKLLSFIKSCMS